MKLPFSLFKKETPKSYYLALLLHDESVRAVIFEEDAGEMHVVNEHEALLARSLEEISEEALLEACDKAISTAESVLPENIETHKTIFGLKESWVDLTNIKKERLATLKKLCDELSLQPLGFLVFSEAIAHLLQKKEGAPVSGVLVELGKNILTVTLLRAGRIVEVRQAPMSDMLPKAVDTLLQQFTNVEILPSRIIVFDPQRQPKLSQTFIHHQWTKTLPFLHMPQITSLEEGFDTQAILYGTATQMGFTMSTLPIPPRKEPSTATVTTPLQETKEEEETNEEEQKEIPTPKEKEPSEEEKQETKPISTIADAENFGFVQGKDVLTDAPKHPHTPPIIHGDNFQTPEVTQAFAEIPEAVKDDEEGIRHGTIGANATFLAEGAKQITEKLRFMKFPSLSFLKTKRTVNSVVTPEIQRNPHTRFSPILLLIPLFLLILVGGALWYIFGVSATVTLTLAPNVVSNSSDVTFSTSAATDTQKNIIGGSQVTVDESGSASTNTSGSKDVGNAAKGSITIYNLSDSSQSFSSGATITSSNGLKFTLDSAVTVASGSSDPINPVAGKANVNVTAANIGTDYNLPSGTKFSIGTSGNVAAQNSSAFSGGTKKTVTVVAQSDVDKLTDDLINQLKGKAQSDLAAKADGSKGILPVFLKTTLSKQSLDNKVGTQATSVTLQGTITFAGIAYQKSDLDTLAKANLASKIDQNKLTSQGITENIGDGTVKNDSIKSQVTFKAGLLPQIDTEGLTKQIAGKTYGQAQNIFAGLPQYSDMQVQLSPHLFFLPKILPRLSSHIHIVVTSQ